MASYVPPGKKEAGLEDAGAQVHRIRITLTSRNVKNLEKVCADLKKGAVDKKLNVKGPVRLPTTPLWGAGGDRNANFVRSYGSG